MHNPYAVQFAVTLPDVGLYISIRIAVSLLVRYMLIFLKLALQRANPHAQINLYPYGISGMNISAEL